MPAGRSAKSLMGKEIANHLKGTRISAHLLDIRDRFGAGDGYLKALATAALRGGHKFEGKDVFTAIRDRLHEHANDPGFAAGDPLENPEGYKKRAGELATGFNWHRMQDALQLDQYVHSHIRGLAKNPHGGDFLRKAHEHISKGTGLGQGLLHSIRGAAKQWTGPNSGLGASGRQVSEENIRKSVERLARLEGYKEGLTARAAKKLTETRPTHGYKGTKPVEEIDTLNWLPGKGAAYTSRDGRVTVNKGLDAEQYHKPESEVVKFALTLNSLFGKKSAAPPVGPDGIAFGGSPGSQHEPAHPANLERQAVAQQLHSLGVIDLHDVTKKDFNHQKVHKYVTHLRNTIRGNPGDPLSAHYLDHLQANATRTHTAKTLQEALAPAVNYTASRVFPDRPDLHPVKKRDLGLPPSDPDLDLADPAHHADQQTVLAHHKESQSEPFHVMSLDQAAESRKVADDTPIKVDLPKKVAKAPIQKEKDKGRLTERDNRGFAALQDAQDRSVPQEGWVEHLKAAGFNNRDAQAVVKKFLTKSKGKKPLPDLRPLKLSAAELAQKYNKVRSALQ